MDKASTFTQERKVGTIREAMDEGDFHLTGIFVEESIFWVVKACTELLSNSLISCQEWKMDSTLKWNPFDEYLGNASKWTIYVHDRFRLASTNGPRNELGAASAIQE